MFILFWCLRSIKVDKLNGNLCNAEEVCCFICYDQHWLRSVSRGLWLLLCCSNEAFWDLIFASYGPRLQVLLVGVTFFCYGFASFWSSILLFIYQYCLLSKWNIFFGVWVYGAFVSHWSARISGLVTFSLFLAHEYQNGVPPTEFIFLIENHIWAPQTVSTTYWAIFMANSLNIAQLTLFIWHLFDKTLYEPKIKK